MVEGRNVPIELGGQAYEPSEEAIWIRKFLEYSGTQNITRFRVADMIDVSLTRAREAILEGVEVHSEKCDGPGSICVFRHAAEDGVVEVEVYFVANEMMLEIRGARLEEVRGGSNAA